MYNIIVVTASHKRHATPTLHSTSIADGKGFLCQAEYGGQEFTTQQAGRQSDVMKYSKFPVLVSIQEESMALFQFCTNDIDKNERKLGER